MTDSANVTAELSAYIAGEKAPPLPPEIIARGKTHILDTRGVTRDLGSRYELADTGIEVYPAGREFKVLVDRVPGAPYNPISSEEVEETFLSLCVPALGEKRSHSAVRRLRNPHNLPDVTGPAE